MRQGLFIAVCFLLAINAYGQAETAAERAPIEILVTIADPGAAKVKLTGRPGPGYRRRSLYFASVGAENTAIRIANEYQLERLDDWSIRPLNVFCLVFAVPRDTGVEQLLEELRARPDVDSAQRLNKFSLLSSLDETGVDPYSGLQHVIGTLELSTAHAWSTGAGVNVAIIDTGADFTHPDLKTQIAWHRSFVGKPGRDFTSDSHGTAIAGVIAAATGNGFGIVGVAPAARLSVLKACWYTAARASAICDSFTIARALAYAIEKKADVINLSLGGPADALLSRLALEALRRGAVIIGAAPGDRARGFPADVPGVIVVDSAEITADNGTREFTVVRAPGHDILVTTPRGSFDYQSGSSLAAAHVTGVVALLMAINPKLGAGDIHTLISDSQSIDDNSVNACRAVAQLIGESGCRKLIGQDTRVLPIH